jgi:Kef-type K+ transport system membrane component KefB
VTDDRPREEPRAGLVRRHPVISAVLVACTVAGAVLGAFLLTGEWSLARRVGAGAVAGGGVGFLITATKML